MNTNELQEELELDDQDCNFIGKMITFDKKCEKDGEENLLHV